MPKGQSIHWSPEHAAIVAEWIKKYPKGKTINLKQIEYAEPEKWKELLNANHGPGAIRDKARHMLGLKPEKKDRPSQSTRSARLDDGRYQCKVCGEIVVNKQSLGAHYRYNCPGPQPKQIPQPTQTNSSAWNFCPNCAYPLTH